MWQEKQRGGESEGRMIQLLLAWRMRKGPVNREM